ncbi:alpha-1-antitrypsin-like [Hyperolius riggenbachi]|uniref:alpha-1-antitrypsin-like n=1 Tax=Hyperolius riggenbachi TaxID=752182 RepID=UPI0035A31B06
MQPFIYSRTMQVFLLVSLSQALLCTVFFRFLNNYEEEEHDSDDHLLQMIVEGNSKFAYTFFTHLANENPNQNIFCSPISISMLFSMISAGAKGQTQTQILEGLDFNATLNSEKNVRKGYKHLLKMLTQTNSDSVLSIANALFAEKNTMFLKKFLDDLKDYQAEAISTDFQKSEDAKNQINRYVEEKTNGMIKNLLGSVDPQTVAVALNTIYFKGKWKDAFDKRRTHDADFHVDNKTVITVPMMSRQGSYRTAYIREVGCTLVEVPYLGSISAFFIVPDPGRFEDLMRALKNNFISKWIEEMEPMYEGILLSIPKFKMSSAVDLKKELTALGIKRVFSNNADLTGVTGSKELKVSEAVQKAVVSVDESGTEAAAASAGGLTLHGMPPEIKVNRPFVFLIRENRAKVDLFIGKLIKPKN